MIITQFNLDSFLKNNWQISPCVIKNFVDNFRDPMDEHDLAGLAQESYIDSRIISQNAGIWSKSDGPFESFGHCCTGHWTLLVQSVDRYISDVSKLAELIDFVPYWRMDDVMVSYSTEHAGVGPHIDQYDVFIIQGRGSRRWKVGKPGNYQTVTPCTGLRQIDSFSAHIDEILMPGDALYIPPNHPHNGVALEPCMNYSIGFRAPSNLELLHELTAFDQFTPSAISRFSSSQTPSYYLDLNNRKINKNSVNQQDLQAMKASIIQLLNSSDTEEGLMRILSQRHVELSSSNEEFDCKELEYYFNSNPMISRSFGLVPIFKEQNDASMFKFYIEGQQYSCSLSLKPYVIQLLTSDRFNTKDLLEDLDNSQKLEVLNLLRTLINEGLWCI